MLESAFNVENRKGTLTKNMVLINFDFVNYFLGNKLRYPGDCYNIDLTSPRKAKTVVNVMRTVLEKKNKQIERLQKNVLRKDKKIKSMQQLLKQLRQKYLLYDNLEANLKVKNFDGLLWEMD